MSAAERTYTLAEARAELQREECRQRGHEWDILSTTSGPYLLTCRCGKAYRISALADAKGPS